MVSRGDKRSKFVGLQSKFSHQHPTFLCTSRWIFKHTNLIKLNREAIMENYHCLSMPIEFLKVKPKKKKPWKSRFYSNAWQFDSSEANLIKISTETTMARGREKRRQKKIVFVSFQSLARRRHNCLKLSFRSVQIFIEKAFSILFFWECSIHSQMS